MFTIQYFIDKFTAIPEDQWCSYTQVNAQGQRCAYGHCVPEDLRKGNTGVNALAFPEGKAFYQLEKIYFSGLRNFSFAHINNGEEERFQQPTEKQRVLAALQWCKEQESQKIIASALAGPDEEDDNEDDWDQDERNGFTGQEEMRKNHPGYSEEAYKTGETLGVNFPYVPGDPFW